MFQILKRLRPRSLRHCVIATVAFGFLLLTAVQYLVTGAFFEHQLQKIESDDGFARLRSLHHALAQLTADLELTASDWAQWDATFNFVSGRGENYVRDNVGHPLALQRLHLDFLVIVDERGRSLFAQSLSKDGLQFERPPADIVAMVEGAGPLSGAGNPQGHQSGLVPTSKGLYLVSSQPVLPSNLMGRTRGRLIMGRSVADYAVPALRRISGEAVELSASVIAAQPFLERRGDQALLLDKNALHGVTQLRDLWNRPVGSLQVRMTRPTQTLLTEARQYLLIATLLICIVFCIIALLLIRSSLIRPIERLSMAVEQIGKNGQPRLELPRVSREFRTLTAAIDEMLRQVERQQALQRDRDAALEASRLKSEFLATMSHEIRTPMNGVLGMCELLQRTDLSSRQKHLSDTILRSARSLLGILNDVLDFSKIEAGKLELEYAPFSPADLVHSVSAPFLAAAQAKGLEFSARIESDVPALVMGDALRLRQVLNNLLSNAIKFTEQGSVSIACAAACERDRIELLFAVADTGIGIDAQTQQRIFEPFAQASTDTSRVYGGTGLGLAIVRRLAALMGGAVQVFSEPGRGSRFTFAMTVRPCAALPQLHAGLAESTGVRFSLHNAPTVLLAEDNDVNREVFTEMLEHFGCRVTAVENGALAVAAVAERVFDAILMDCQMPVMDGHAATTALRALERMTAQKPAFIVALTADATPENRQRCLDAGMDAVVTKPIAHTQLRKLILQALQPTSAAPA